MGKIAIIREQESAQTYGLLGGTPLPVPDGVACGREAVEGDEAEVPDGRRAAEHVRDEPEVAGGAPQHPGWYRNILANPEVEVQVGTKKMKARARTAAGEERLRLWKKALEFWPPYADYQLMTERQIPVVVLDPIH